MRILAFAVLGSCLLAGCQHLQTGNAGAERRAVEQYDRDVRKHQVQDARGRQERQRCTRDRGKKC